MDGNNLVTVVIPTWNRAGLVEQAVASVDAQTYENWELVVIDDGSTDDTVERIGRLSVPNIRFVQTPHLGHIGRLRNLGAAAGRCPLIAFLDSDDLWCPRKLETQLRAMEEMHGWSYTEYGLLGEDGLQIPLRSGRAPAISTDVLQALLKQETGICPCTLLVRRSLFESIGGFSEDPRLAVRDDVEIAFRLARASPVIAIPERLTLVREHEGRLTKSLSHPYEHSAVPYEFFLAHETDRELAKLARERWADCIGKAGTQRLLAGDLACGAVLLWRSLVGRFRYS